ncbi:ABC transporter ATP-binding protein [Microbacterium sp. YY-03]|uniref:ABC transporter ATP-binding protein n=1 Tax=Microbacterium sp. YY-03 TaxID=3421636 RepID=UPI003D181459
MTVPEATAPPPPLLRVRDLTITHTGNAAPAPQGVSFDVFPGDVLLILGPSGAGKSTLTLALNGLIPHDIPADISGTVEIDALTAPAATPAQLSPHVAMVFQDPDAQLVTGSVYDEVAFGLENLLLPVPTIHAKVEAALRKVGLWDRRRANPDALSGGGRQRLAIACALAMGAPVLVLDEPTANLDPQGIDEVYAALADLVADGEQAIILVEHNLDAAMGFVTRVLVLDEAGRVAHDGTPEQILRERADELNALGVWLPEATLAALTLRERGMAIDPLPLTASELAAALPPRTTINSPAVAQVPPAPVVAQVRNLTFEREHMSVLSDVSLDIVEQSFTAIVGANGAGKTTLLQLMCGVMRPPKNVVSIAGIDPAKARARVIADRIGFVFQNPEHQFMTATVFDELAYELRARKRPEAEVRERTEAMLERFGLADKAGMHPFLLSGGQKRRLSVGTALLSGARILALDEPTFGQDRARAHELLDLLRELQNDGTTILVVTHDMQLVADYSTHTIALAAGRVIASGTTRDVWAQPAALEAAGLRVPPVQRAMQSRADYADVWRISDLAQAGADA